MATATIFDAKTNLSELIEKVQNGEEVIITSGRGKTPVAKLVPIAPVVKKRLGARARIPISCCQIHSGTRCLKMN
jgi:prevent-host-death family protein